MASFAQLSREERTGLGIAAVLHVALVAALVLQVQDDPTPLPIPERMDVSLADEVSLESTAPDPSAEPQAAIAPTLAPEPAPVVEREPERPVVRPTPVTRPTAAPRPSPRPTTTPAPRPTQRPGGSRIGDDFLEGTGGSERSNARGTPAATFGPAEAASLNQAIARQLKPHWSSPQGVDVEKLVTLVRFRLNPDGSLSGRPACVSQSGETPSNAAQKDLHCERAIRAVQLAAPFDLPDEFYDKWKLVTSRFDRRL
ncbi:MAG TPA: energy transducer TonB [Croceibacterium sp.]|nr:energy transducer TonB [Croceibacterium sp.]